MGRDFDLKVWEIYVTPDSRRFCLPWHLTYDEVCDLAVSFFRNSGKLRIDPKDWTAIIGSQAE